jgi:hypothetical protein
MFRTPRPPGPLRRPGANTCWWPQAQDAPSHQPPAVVADRRGRPRWHEPRCSRRPAFMLGRAPRRRHHASSCFARQARLGGPPRHSCSSGAPSGLEIRALQASGSTGMKHPGGSKAGLADAAGRAALLLPGGWRSSEAPFIRQGARRVWARPQECRCLFDADPLKLSLGGANVGSSG